MLVSYFSLLAICHSFSFTALSVQGKDNPVADALSHFQFQWFRQLVPHAAQAPTAIPASLLSALQVI